MMPCLSIPNDESPVFIHKQDKCLFCVTEQYSRFDLIEMLSVMKVYFMQED
jgi:hypothetical protein